MPAPSMRPAATSTSRGRGPSTAGRRGWLPRFLVLEDGGRVLTLERPWPLHRRLERLHPARAGAGRRRRRRARGPPGGRQRGPRRARRGRRRRGPRGPGRGRGLRGRDPRGGLRADRGDPAVAPPDHARARRWRRRDARVRPHREVDAAADPRRRGVGAGRRPPRRSRRRDGVGEGFVGPAEAAEAALDRFYDLLLATGERRQFTFGPRAGFVGWWRAALAAGHLVYLEVRDGGADGTAAGRPRPVSPRRPPLDRALGRPRRDAAHASGRPPPRALAGHPAGDPRGFERDGPRWRRPARRAPRAASRASRCGGCTSTSSGSAAGGSRWPAPTSASSGRGATRQDGWRPASPGWSGDDRRGRIAELLAAAEPHRRPRARRPHRPPDRRGAAARRPPRWPGDRRGRPRRRRGHRRDRRLARRPRRVRCSSRSPGAHVDGHDFVAAAAAAGAGAAIVARPCPRSPSRSSSSRDAHPALATAAAWWYDDPSHELAVVGITGTDGKTTTAFLAVAALEAAGVRTGMIGTAATRIGGVQEANEAHVTTPEAPALQRGAARDGRGRRHARRSSRAPRTASRSSGSGRSRTTSRS